MEITFKMTEEMLQEAFEKALNDLVIETNGMTLNEWVGKQMPKKPIEQYAEDEPQWICPICRQWLYADEVYCDRCGQRLNWEEV